MTMYAGTYVEVYDRVMRSRNRDHAAQSAAIARLIRSRNATASALLDIACGTGLHLQGLHGLFDHVAGLDASDDMLTLARARIPGLTTFLADMREIDLPVCFDAITCLFALPHLGSVEELETTVAGLVRHLTPGGIVVIEPWYAPKDFVSGYVSTDVIEDAESTVIRLSHSHRLDDEHRIRMVVHHAEAGTTTGLRHATETLDLTLFTRKDYQRAFGAAGCTAEYVTQSPFTWGLWIAQRAG